MTAGEIASITVALIVAVMTFAGMKDEGRARFARWMKTGITQIVMIAIIFYAIFNTIQFLTMDGPATRGDIGLLLTWLYNGRMYGEWWINGLSRAYHRYTANKDTKE